MNEIQRTKMKNDETQKVNFVFCLFFFLNKKGRAFGKNCQKVFFEKIECLDSTYGHNIFTKISQ